MKINVEDLKRIVLEEAITMSEADMSSPAGDFDSPAKVKKLYDEALAAIKELPVNHKKLLDHVNQLMMQLSSAQTEEQLVAVRDAAIAWHDRARQLMKARDFKSPEYEDEPEVQAESRRDGSLRDAFKDILDHLRPEDVVNATHDAWAGGGERSDNLVAPVDQLKRQTGVECLTTPETVPVADNPDNGYPPIPVNESKFVKSLAHFTRYSPEDHLAPHRPMSAMKSLADVMLEADIEVEEEVAAVPLPIPQTIQDPQILRAELVAIANEEAVDAWLSGAQNLELDASIAKISGMNRDALSSLLGIEVSGVEDEARGEPDPNLLLDVGVDVDESVNESHSNERWLTMAGILN